MKLKFNFAHLDIAVMLDRKRHGPWRICIEESGLDKEIIGHISAAEMILEGKNKKESLPIFDGWVLYEPKKL